MRHIAAGDGWPYPWRRMQLPPRHQTDPIRWHVAMATVFAILCLVRLGMPGEPFFDEVHYLPAARALFGVGPVLNLEHPPLGKELIALGMTLFGDNPFGWRIMSLLFGVLALFAAMRALWFASQDRAASMLGGLFLITGFPLLVQARIAMLDIFMITFVMLALWMCAAAVRENETARWRLAIAGAAMGAAMAAKWNAVPVAILPGLAFLASRMHSARGGFLTARRGWPIGGMTLWEAALWLGVLPLVTYALAFYPYLFQRIQGDPTGLLSLHREMLDLQTQVLQPHPYQSNWWQWVSNWRAIWYLYEPVDGAQRGVLLIGNPLTSLVAVPALVWCGWMAVQHQRRDCGALVLLYLASLVVWIVAPKPVQFYYHYVLPHCFAMGALALATVWAWQKGERLLPLALVAVSTGLFAWFYPILTAAKLDGEMAFLDWAWVTGWR